MNILIIGYGKMGKTIEAIALGRSHHISYKIDQHTDDTFENIHPDQVDVAIEFTQPDAAPGNIRFCLENDIPVISGTTGWLSQKPTLEALCQQKNGAFFYASNFSIGVNLFFQLNRYLAGMMKSYPEYKPDLKETHHIHKKDAPSGTAITLAEDILAAIPALENWELEEEKNHKKDEKSVLSIQSVREGEIPGTHIVNYTSAVDDITITHTAHSRQGFALGAVLVAEWIQGKKGVLNMDDFLKL